MSWVLKSSLLILTKFLLPAENELRLEGASDETKALIDALFEVIAAEGEDPLIVYIRDVESWILNNFEAYTSFKERIERVRGRVLVMTSYISKVSGLGRGLGGVDLRRGAERDSEDIIRERERREPDF